jgi:hypothetical protein
MDLGELIEQSRLPTPDRCTLRLGLPQSSARAHSHRRRNFRVGDNTLRTINVGSRERGLGPQLTGPTKNKDSKRGMFFAADFYGVFHHTFTTILRAFTTQNTTYLARIFSKHPKKRENRHTRKKSAQRNKI